MKNQGNESLSLGNFWATVSQQSQEVLGAGDTPFLIIDLDGTLVDYTLRTYQIFQKALQELDLPDKIKKIVNDIKPEDYDYFPKTNFIKLGIKDKSIIDKLTDFWTDHYFTNQYLHYDRQIPGAYDFITCVLSLDINVVYLTGRDDENMGEGTRTWLEKNGFLDNHNSRCRLMMKMDLTIENFESKARNGEKIGKLGQPVLIVDNEPIELETMCGRFPEATPVLVEMPNSGKPATLPPNTLKVENFLELNSVFKK